MNNLHNLDNKIKTKINSGGVSIGVFLVSGSPFIAEAMANFPVDWMLIDFEASHITNENLLHILQAINGYEITPVVRVADQNRRMVEFCLDLGAKGVMIPKVDTAEQAAEVSNACYYQPKGNRGIGGIRASAFYTNTKEYLDKANDCILSIVQIESKESIANLDSIAGTANVEVLFMGLGDLAASYGQIGNVEGKLIDEARQKVVAACRKYNKIPGIYAHSIDVINQYIEEGFTFIAIGNEIKFISQGLADSLNKIGLRS